MYSIRSFVTIGIVSMLLAGCGGGDSNSGARDLAGVFTMDMRGRWQGTLGDDHGSVSYDMLITEATGGQDAGQLTLSNSRRGPISLTKNGNELTIVVAYKDTDCVGTFSGDLTWINTARGIYSEQGSDCDFHGNWSMHR